MAAADLPGYNNRTWASLDDDAARWRRLHYFATEGGNQKNQGRLQRQGVGSVAAPAANTGAFLLCRCRDERLSGW